MYSVVDVDTSNRTLALNGKFKHRAFQAFLDEYLLFKRAYETEFDTFYEDILPQNAMVGFGLGWKRFIRGWPFINEQAVLESFTSSDGYWTTDMTYEVQQKLDVVEIYFKAPTFDQVVKDARTNFVTKISMLGGTLGLFTGFSVLSGIEIIYFLLLLFVRMLKR